MNTSMVKQVLLFILGVAIMIALLFVFFYVFVFFAVIGLIYYIYRRFFKRVNKETKINDEVKKVNPVIIDMDD